MENKKIKSGDLLDLPQSFIVLMVPDDIVEVDINAKIYIDHALHEVTSHMDFPEVRAAIRDGMENYIPDDALFMLTPTKRERMEKLLERYTPEEDDL